MKKTKNTRKLTMSQRHSLEGYLFILPWIIGFILFFIIPFFDSIRLSLSKITKVSGFEMEWLGWDHYIRAFVWDINFVPIFLVVVKNTIINTPLTLIFALFIAMLVDKDIKFRAFFRGTFFLPVLLGTGFVLNQLLGMGVDEQAMEMARGMVMPEEVLLYLGPIVAETVSNFMNRITLTFWQSGVQIIIFLAGLQGISNSLYEAAECDGASEWEMFWKITLPIISPVILLNIIYTLIDSFTASTNPLISYMLNLKRSIEQYEYAAALGMIYFVFIFLLVLLVYKISSRIVFNSGEK